MTSSPCSHYPNEALHCHLICPALCQILSDLHELIMDWVSAIELWVTYYVQCYRTSRPSFLHGPYWCSSQHENKDTNCESSLYFLNKLLSGIYSFGFAMGTFVLISCFFVLFCKWFHFCFCWGHFIYLFIYLFVLFWCIDIYSSNSLPIKIYCADASSG